MHEVGEAQLGVVGTKALPRPGQTGQLGISGRKDDDVARALAEVGRLAAVGDGTGLGL